MNNTKFTYDRLESVKFGFRIFYMFSQVLINRVQQTKLVCFRLKKRKDMLKFQNNRRDMFSTALQGNRVL